jgi:bifunctional DNA-binding transcriptional regulator/antitoxin component of YhaV-PrlF toxin-antitoxin module
MKTIVSIEGQIVIPAEIREQVTEEQLGLFHHIDQSRGLQQQLSHDLIHDPPR